MYDYIMKMGMGVLKFLSRTEKTVKIKTFHRLPYIW